MSDKPASAAEAFRRKSGNDHVAALAQLRKMREAYGYEFTDLRTMEGFKDFVKSPSFQDWPADLAK